jgi:hypothetical protein
MAHDVLTAHVNERGFPVRGAIPLGRAQAHVRAVATSEFLSARDRVRCLLPRREARSGDHQHQEQ